MLALLVVDEALVERSIELYALASRYLFVTKSCWLKDVVGRETSEIAAAIPADALADIERRGRAQDLETTAA